MINTNSYLDLLEELLRGYYSVIKETGTSSQERRHYINGYMTAARVLNAVYQKDLKDRAERVHAEIFHMTIEERKKSEKTKPDVSENDMDLPAYKRKGIKLVL